MGTSTTRRDKVEWMRETINIFFLKKPKGWINKNKLLAEFAFQNLSTKRTGLEILNMLEDSGFIKIDGDKLYGKI